MVGDTNKSNAEFCLRAGRGEVAGKSRGGRGILRGFEKVRGFLGDLKRSGDS